MAFINQTLVPDWSTTAPDGQIEIWSTGFAGVPSYEGNQFAELNANFASTLIKSFVAEAGVTLEISFAHRGRAGIDVMSLQVGPQGGPYVNLGNFSDGNTSWGFYQRYYTPSLSGSHELRFVSVSAAGGATVGNFLDAVDPGVSVTAIIEPPGVYSSTPIILDGSASSSGPSIIYEWTTNNGIILSGANTPYATVASAGTYMLMVTNTYLNCKDSSSVDVIAAPNILNVSFRTCFDTITTVNSKPFILRGGLPLGGIYSGPGVNSSTGLFSPSLAGPGSHTITYTVINSSQNSGSAIKQIVVLSSGSFICGQTLNDIRDNTNYSTTLINSRCWFTENLKYGTMIPYLQPQTDNCIHEKYCFQNNLLECSSSGGYYQWDELMHYQNPPTGESIQGLCPPEWHIPTQQEWTDLINTVAKITPGDGLAGDSLKTNYQNLGFNVLLDGIVYLNNLWPFTSGNLTATMFWTSTSYETMRAIARGLNNYNPSVSYYPSSRANAFPVRCIRDNGAP